MKTEIIDVLSWAAVFDQGLKSSEVLRYLTKKSTIEEVSAVLVVSTSSSKGREDGTSQEKNTPV